MQLAELKKMDQKNRIHINTDYLRLLGIKDNATVTVAVNTGENCIKIIPISANDEKMIRKILPTGVEIR